MQVEGLDEACDRCGRVRGDHTLREWVECVGHPTVDLPYEEVPPETARMAEELRGRMGLDDDVIVADHAVVQAMTLGGVGEGGLRVVVPTLMHDFQMGRPGQPPTTLVKVAFIAGPEVMRAYGRLARDCANGAANAAERG